MRVVSTYGEWDGSFSRRVCSAIQINTERDDAGMCRAVHRLDIAVGDMRDNI